MKEIKILFIILTLILVSCKAAIMKSYGVKNPQFETVQSTSDYLERYSVNSEKLWITRDFDAYASLVNTKEPPISFPDAYFFNAEGKFLEYRKSAEDCNANVENFINELSEILLTDQGGSFTIDYFLNHIYNKNLKEVSIEPDVDGFLVITWSIFMGDKLNKEKAFDWVDLIKKLNQEGLTIHYYLLNLDPQKSWDLSPEHEKELLENFKLR